MLVPATVVISCAGLGTRLGLGIPKSLLEFGGRPLIQWQLRMLNAVDDVRVVVGFRAEDIIQAARDVRNDITFVYNHRYAATGTAHSLYLGARFAPGDVISLDGDLVVSPSDFRDWIGTPGRRIGVSEPRSSEPVYVTARDEPNSAVGFSRREGRWEWTGLLRLPASEIRQHDGHVFQMLEDFTTDRDNHDRLHGCRHGGRLRSRSRTLRTACLTTRHRYVATDRQRLRRLFLASAGGTP